MVPPCHLLPVPTRGVLCWLALGSLCLAHINPTAESLTPAPGHQPQVQGLCRQTSKKTQPRPRDEVLDSTQLITPQGPQAAADLCCLPAVNKPRSIRDSSQLSPAQSPAFLSGRGWGSQDRKCPVGSTPTFFVELVLSTSPSLHSRLVVTSSRSTSACPSAHTNALEVHCPTVKPTVRQALSLLCCQQVQGTQADPQGWIISPVS